MPERPEVTHWDHNAYNHDHLLNRLPISFAAAWTVVAWATLLDVSPSGAEIIDLWVLT